MVDSDNTIFDKNIIHDLIFKKFFEANNHLYCITTFEGNFKYINKSFIEKLGYSYEEIISSKFVKFVHPDDIVATSKTIEKLKEGEEILAFENRNITADRSDIWLEWTLIPNVKEKLIYGIARDITKFKFYQTANRKLLNDILFKNIENIEYISNPIQSLIIDFIPESLILLNDKFEILVYNQAFKHLYTDLYNEEIEKLLSYPSLLDIPSKTGLISTIIKMIKSESKELKFNPKLGIYFRFIQSSIGNHSLILFYDESKITNLENIRQKVMSTVSHELRTPVSAIYQTTSNYKTFKERLNEQQLDKMWDIVHTNSILMNDLVDDLLTLFQLSEKKIKLNIQSHYFKEIIQSVLNSLNPVISNKKASVSLEFDERELITVDQRRISQVLRILIDNSLKYSTKIPEIKVICDNKSSNDSSKVTKINIIDNGIGIPIEDQKNLFTRFYRASNTDNYKGTGIGLTIAKEIIDLHNGTISVISDIGKGASFEIVLPNLQ